MTLPSNSIIARLPRIARAIRFHVLLEYEITICMEFRYASVDAVTWLSVASLYGSHYIDVGLHNYISVFQSQYDGGSKQSQCFKYKRDAIRFLSGPNITYS